MRNQTHRKLQFSLNNWGESAKFILNLFSVLKKTVMGLSSCGLSKTLNNNSSHMPQNLHLQSHLVDKASRIRGKNYCKLLSLD